MTDITNFAAARGIKPATVLQIAAGMSGTTWEKWRAGSATCSMRTAERIRDYISANPVATLHKDAV